MYAFTAVSGDENIHLLCGPIQAKVLNLGLKPCKQVSKHARCCKNGKITRPNSTFTAGEYSHLLRLINNNLILNLSS